MSPNAAPVTRPPSKPQAGPVATPRARVAKSPRGPTATAPPQHEGAPVVGRLLHLAGTGAGAGTSAARTLTSATTSSAARAGRWGIGAVRGPARAVAGVFGGTEPAQATTGAGEPAVAFSARIPFASASLRLPGPGAVGTLGPVRVTLPTRGLYYGGLGALAITGALDPMVAAGAALAGVAFGRRLLRGSIPEAGRSDEVAAPAPHATSNGAAPAS